MIFNRNIIEHYTLFKTAQEIFKDKLTHNNTLDFFQEGKSFSIRIKTVSRTANKNSFTVVLTGERIKGWAHGVYHICIDKY